MRGRQRHSKQLQKSHRIPTQLAKPKTTVYNNFKALKGLSQGSMNFEQFAATVRKLVNDCNIQNTQDKDSIIRNFIVTGANSETAYQKCVEAGPDASLERILEIYRNEAAVQAHFQTRPSSQPIVHQMNAELNSSKEGGEEDIHKLYDRRKYNENTRISTAEKRYRGNTGRACHWCGNSHKP